MTAVQQGQNPYGDQSGNAPSWDYQQGLIQTSYDNALQKLQAQREGMLQQYGFTSSGGLNDILSGKGASVSFNPQYQNSIYGQAMQKHGRDLQSLRQATIMRGLGDSGLGAQAEAQYQTQAAGENEAIKQKMLGDLTGNVTDAQAALLNRNQQTTDLSNQRSLYNQWANSHYQSEGGNKRDPYDTEIIQGRVADQFKNLNFGDRIAAGATLGRVRDQINEYLKYAGMEGYNSAQLKMMVKQYQDSLKKAGYKASDPKWRLSEDSLNPKPDTVKTAHKGNYHGYNSKHEYEAAIRRQNRGRKRRAGGGAYHGNEGGGSAAGGA